MAFHLLKCIPVISISHLPSPCNIRSVQSIYLLSRRFKTHSSTYKNFKTCKIPSAVWNITSKYEYQLYKRSAHTYGMCNENDGVESETEMKRRNVQEQMLVSVVEQGHGLKTSEWNEVNEKVISAHGYINDFNIDGVIMGMCITLKQFDVGTSYLEYIIASGKDVNIATLSRYLKLCYICKHDTINAQLEEKIITAYNHLRKLCPLMDATTAENVIHGLAITQYWEEGLELLTMIKTTCSPSASTYNVLVKAAFDHGNVDIGWELMNDMLTKERKPMPLAYHAWLDYCSKLVDNNRMVKNDLVKQLLLYLMENDLKPTKDVAERIRSWFVSLNSKCKGQFTTLINSRGICKSCNKHLSPVKMTSQEFESLRCAFFEEVVKGSNVFIKTTPTELESFQVFVKRTAPYDVVIDGLNVAYSAGRARLSPQISSGMLQSVVKHFVNKSQKVLVLGRKHMLSWPKNNMDYIHRNAELFLTQNLSQDDPFLLYAAMWSGLGTSFISRDLMRSHVFLLCDRSLKAAFRNWQQQHQYQVVFIADEGKVKLRPPLAFNPSVQSSSDGSWHIPYDLEFVQLPPQTLDPPEHWLCLCQHS